MHRLSAIAVAVFATLSTHCLPSKTCTDIGIPGISLRLRDARTRAIICDAIVVASDSEHTEQLGNWTLEPNCIYAGLIGRPGEYDVFIHAPGYFAAKLESREVDVNDCGHATTGRIVDIDLEPDPNAPRRAVAEPPPEEGPAPTPYSPPFEECEECLERYGRSF